MHSVFSDYVQFPYFEHYSFQAPQVFYFNPYAQIYPQSSPSQPVTSSDNHKDSEGECQTRCRHTWSKQEDAQLLKLIKSLNLSPDKPMPFTLIAEKFPGRSAKQIRQRYQNKLDTTILRTKFTETEDRVILEFYKTNGPKWKQLSKRLEGRTPISLRNRFNAKIKRRLIDDMNESDEQPLKIEDSH